MTPLFNATATKVRRLAEQSPTHDSLRRLLTVMIKAGWSLHDIVAITTEEAAFVAFERNDHVQLKAAAALRCHRNTYNVALHNWIRRRERENG